MVDSKSAARTGTPQFRSGRRRLPRWRRLACALSDSIVTRFSGYMYDNNISHGCTERNVLQLLSSLLTGHALEIEEESAACILVVAHVLLTLQEPDILKTGWKPLVVTGVLAAMIAVLGFEACETAKRDFWRSISWPEEQASRTLEVFCGSASQFRISVLKSSSAVQDLLASAKHDVGFTAKGRLLACSTTSHHARHGSTLSLGTGSVVPSLEDNELVSI